MLRFTRKINLALPKTMNQEIKPLNVLIKGLLLFALFNLVIAA